MVYFYIYFLNSLNYDIDISMEKKTRNKNWKRGFQIKNVQFQNIEEEKNTYI